MDMNTPSGEIRTTLDKFVYNYVLKGYQWGFDGDNIIFTSNNDKLLATAQYDDKNWITGFIIDRI